MAPPKKPAAAAPPAPAPEPPVEEPVVQEKEPEQPEAPAAAAHDDGDPTEIAAVGTVAHVVKRAFRQFYNDDDDTETYTRAVAPAPSPEPQVAQSDAPQPPEDAAAVQDAATEETEAAAAPAIEEHAYVALGAARKQLLRDSLALTKSTARELLAFLDERTCAAAAQDEAAAAELARHGLVVRAQIPVGPSPLELETAELAPFGAFADTLVLAKTLVRAYHAERLDRSGNGPAFLARRVAGITREPPGYLGSTSSADTRKETTLTLHEHHIQTVKAQAAASAKPHDEPEDDDGTGTAAPSSDSSHHKRDDVMPAPERRKNMVILERMQTKLDFLRNPRFALSSAALYSPDDAAAQAPAVFEAVPSPVAFTDYDVGGVYEQTVVLRNASTLSRRVRVLPPATLYFSVAQLAFPDASGLVAPGMHVRVTLRFAPDSRADYKDALTVQFENGGGSPAASELVVPVLARRAPPELSIPLLLRAPPTLVGTQSVTSLRCTNSGGKARFWLMSERDWARCEASAAFRNDGGGPNGVVAAVLREFAAQGGALRVGAFSLAPHELELDTGESVTLQLTFLPAGVGEQRDKFVMVCDNCLVRVFQLAGRGCQVDVGIAAVNAQTVDRSIANMSRVARLVFPRALRLGATETQRLRVSNDTPLAVRFTWRLEQDGGGQRDDSDRTCPFTVSPPTGVLPASDAAAFEVAFSPHAARRFARWRLVLDVNDVPPCALPGASQLALLGETLPALREAACAQPLGDALVAPLSAAVPAVEALRVALHGTGELGAFHLNPAAVAVVDHAGGHELALGECYRVTTRVVNDCDAWIHIRWELARARLLPAPARPGDRSLFELALDLDSKDDDAATIAVAPRAFADVCLAFTPRAVGRFAVLVPCAIVDPLDSASRVERWLRLEGTVENAQLRIASREVDFGLVLASASADATLTLRNGARAAAGDWTLVHLEAPAVSATAAASPDGHDATLRRASSKDSLVSSSRGGAPSTTRSSTGSLGMATGRDLPPRASVAFAPSTGRLAPGASVDVLVTCQAGTQPERFRGTFALAPASTPPAFPSLGADDTDRTLETSSCVSARAEIQSPNVFLTPLRVSLGATFLGVRVARELLLVNVSNLEAAFKFAEPQGACKAATLELTPRQGVLRAKETLRVQLAYTPRQAGRTTTLLACAVQGLAAPLGLEVAATHKGLVLTYDVLEDGDESKIPPAPLEIAAARGVAVADGELEPPDGAAHAAPPKLNFGDGVPLAQRRALRLVVRNFSGIDAQLELVPKRYVAAESVGSLDDDSDHTETPKSTTSGSRARISSTKTTKTRKPLLSDAQDAQRRFQSPAGRAFVRAQDDAAQDRALLRGGRGAAFVVHAVDAGPTAPLTSPLRVPPWGRAVVAVTCLNNLPGVYSDVLACRAVGLPPVLLPLHAAVVGTPLALDANCVGLRLAKQTPALSFGHVCVRSPPVTRTLRVLNRGPRAARLAWRLVDPAREHQRVQLALRVDADARVRLRITTLEPRDGADAFPFEISPATSLAAFGSTAVRVTYAPSDEPSAVRALLVADAHWIDEEDAFGHATRSPSSSPAASLMVVDERHQEPPTDPRCEPATASAPSSARVPTAAGKAIQAVRVANAMARSPATPATPPSAANAVAVSASCVRVLLRASAIAPELTLDQKTPRTGPHVRFTTFAPLLAAPDAWQHALHRRELSLVNRLNARVTFRLEATGAFAVTRAESLAPRHPLATADLPPAHRRADGESFLFTLPPQMGVRLELRVDAARVRLPTAATATTAATSTATALSHRVEGALLVRFTNQTVQTLRLACDVLRARLAASPAVHSFGRVHLSRTRTLTLRVANPTRVPAAFRVRHMPRPTPLSRAQRQEMAAHHAHFVDEPGVFVFATESGVVRGPTVSLRSAGGAPQPRGHSTQDLYDVDDVDEDDVDGTSRTRRLVFAVLELVVTFRPRELGKKYRSRFRLCVDAGEDCEVVLQGQGHLDEVEYADQDRPMARAKELTHQNLIFKTLSPAATR